MAFREPEERPGNERWMKIEFGVLLVAQLIIFVAGARYVWNSLSAWF
jgi:hypothetical protein